MIVKRTSGIYEMFGTLEWDATYDCKAERSRQRHPERLLALDTSFVQHLRSLGGGIEVDLDAALSSDDE